MPKRNIKKMEIDYDANADVLYINFGKPQRGIIAEDGDLLSGIIIIKNPLNKKVIGITLDAFTQRVKKGYLDSIVEKTHLYITKEKLLEIYNKIEEKFLQSL